MEKRKVAIFTGLDIRTFGGGEKYAIQTANLLKDFDITLFSYRSNHKHRIKEADLKNITKSKVVFYKALEVPVMIERIPLSIGTFASIKNYDTVYNYDPSVATNLWLMFFAWIYRKKLILGL